MNLAQTLEIARNVLRFRQMSYRTEQSYLHWIKRFGYWCLEHRADSHEDKARGYLTHLARERNVSAATQKQALFDSSRRHHLRRLDHPFDRRLQFHDVPIPRGAVRQAAAEPFLAGFVAGTAGDGGGGGLDLGPHRDGHRGRVTRGRWGGAGCEQGRERYRPAWRGHGIHPGAG